MSTPSQRERVTAMYRTYNPEKLSDVDSLLARCAGDEEALIRRLVEKYGPEPSNQLAADSQATAVTTTASTSAQSPMVLSKAASFSPALAAAASQSFGAFHDSDDEDDALRLQPTGIQALPAGPLASSAVSDPYAKLKSNLANEVGFTDPNDKRKWEDAWLGKLPLGNLRRAWGDQEISAAQGFKFAVHGKPQRWQKRFFVLVPNFLYYFDSDSPASPCKGAVYLDRATITTEEKLQERKAIVIKPRVYKKPLEVVAGGDVSDFKISFQADKTLDKWRDVLIQMTTIAPLPTVVPPPVGPSGSGGAASPTTAAASSYYGSPGAASFRHSQSVRRQPLAMEVGSMPLDPVVPVFGPLPDAPTSMFQQQPAAVISGAAHSPTVAVTATSAALSSLPESSMMHRMPSTKRLEPSTQQLANLQQQQFLQQQAFSLQKQQLEMSEKQRQQNQLQLNIDANDIKVRIKKLSRDREPHAMVETLLGFILDNVDNANQLWFLMDAIDSVPKLPDPELAGQSKLLRAAATGTLNSQMWDSVAAAGSPNDSLSHPSGRGASAPQPQQPPTYSRVVSPPREHVISRDVDERAGAVERIHANWAAASSRNNNNNFISSKGFGAPGGSSDSPERRGVPPSMVRSQQLRQKATFEQFAGPVASGLVDQLSWDDRMSRIRTRKMMVENILNDLPG